MAYRYSILLLFVLIAQFSFAQQNVVNVDPLTGSINIGIPIKTITNGAVSTTVSLVYGGSGIKVKDVEGNGGMGWQVTGGGEIARQVRGLPDDAKKDNSRHARLGWLYNTNGTTIAPHNFANSGGPNCPNEAADTTWIHSNFSNLSDTEPDVFSVNASGLSCQFVFDKNKVIKTIPYRDYKISYDTLGGGGIKEFFVTDNRGVKYTFSNRDTVTRQTTNIAGSTTLSESNIFYNKWEYLQYKFGLGYTDTWSLTSITDPNGNAITFTYTTGINQQSQQPLEYYDGTSTKTTLYWTKEYVTPNILWTITGGGAVVSFTYADNYRTSVPMVQSIGTNNGSYTLNYSQVFSTGSSTGFYRYFLRSVSGDQCDSQFNYNFTYNRETYSSGTYVTSLGDSVSKKIDFWGYQNSALNTDLSPNVMVNPSNAFYQRYQIKADGATRTDYTVEVSGADRKVDTAYVKTGSLNQIKYYNNGTTTIEYEPNDYYDPTGNVTVYGGGIRVKKITVYNGLNTANNIVHSYHYANSSGVSNGKPVTLPVYAFTKVYTGGGTTAAKWAASTVGSELDLSEDDHSILYSQVTMTQAGAGKTLYEYFLPAMNYDNSATPSCAGCTTPDWRPNLMLTAGPGCFSAGFVSSIITTYPFAPQANYDFERGLIKKITNYDNKSNEVSESNYTYTRTSSSIDTIAALRFAYDGTVESYLKYNINTSTSELSQQVSEKVFDLGSTTTSQTTAVNYTYGSAYHKLPTLIQKTKSNGTTESNHIIYSKDYPTATVSSPNVTALYNLQLKNINVPIEQYTDVNTGGTDKVISAQLLKYTPFSLSTTLYLPSQTLGFFDQNGIASSSFTPSYISAGTFVNDSKYIVLANNVIYDNDGFLQTSNDNHKRVSTTLFDLNYHLPVAVVNNAAANEIGYYSYNGQVGTSAFTVTTGTVSTATGRAVQPTYALSLSSAAILSRTVTKNTTAANYIFSIWMNPSVSGNINVVVGGTTYPIAFTNTGGVWKYYEKKIPVSSLGSTFTATFQSTAASAIAIDDVLFYPESAEMTTYTYDPISKAPITLTNTNGVSNYFTVDTLGRLNLTYDQDKNVKQQKSYFYSAAPVFVDPAFSSNDAGLATPGTLVTYSPANSYNQCHFAGATYTWEYGDGDSTVTTTSIPQTHTYASASTYNVTLKVYIPGFGTKSVTHPVTIYPPPPAIIPVLYVNNSTTGGSLNKVTFAQNGMIKYTFTGATLAGGTTKIPAGSYSVNAFKSGTVGSITVATNTTTGCGDTPLPSGKYPTVVIGVLSGDSVTLTVNDNSCN